MVECIVERTDQSNFTIEAAMECAEQLPAMIQSSRRAWTQWRADAVALFAAAVIKQWDWVHAAVPPGVSGAHRRQATTPQGGRFHKCYGHPVGRPASLTKHPTIRSKPLFSPQK